jgi:hypothetical protein
MARWIVVALTLTLLTGCGSGGGSGRAPSASELLTRSLRAAQEERTVRFRADLTLRATLDQDRVASAPPPAQLESLVSLASEPLRLVFDGRRSDEAFEAEGTFEAAGREHSVGVRATRDELFLEVEETWYRAPFTLGRASEIEAFAALVPQEACVHGQSEGCDRVDFGPALASGRLGRLVTGDVAAGPGDTWRLTGTLDPGEFAYFMTSAVPNKADQRSLWEAARATYAPYARSGRILFDADKGDDLPRRFELTYELERQGMREHLRSEALTSPVVGGSGHVVLELSDWGAPVSVTIPASSRPFTEIGDSFEQVLRALYVFL